MRRFISLLNIVVLLGLLAAGCGADVDQPAPAKPKPLEMKVEVDADKWPPEAVIELSGPPDGNWVLFQAPSEASGENAFRYKGKEPINLDNAAKEIKDGQFTTTGTITKTIRFPLDPEEYKPGAQVFFQAISGTADGLETGKILQKTPAIRVTVPLRPLILKVVKVDPPGKSGDDPKVTITLSGQPGYPWVLYRAFNKASEGNTGYYKNVKIKLDSRAKEIVTGDFPMTSTTKITMTFPIVNYLPDEKIHRDFFEAIATIEGEAEEVKIQQSDVVSATWPVPLPEPPAETAIPEQPTETAPGEWKRPCVFDPNPTQPGGYTYVKEGLQILDQDHRKEWGANWCGPTAAGISLGYWAENGYPHLVPDTNKNGRVDEEEKYDIIDELGQKMGTDPDEGTSDNDVVDGLEDFIRQMGSFEHFTVEVYDSDLGTVDPTFADYKRELERCEDVLVGLEWPGGGHWLVGRSVCNVQNPDGTYNADFVDPGTSRVYHTRMDPVTNKIWYGGQWVTFDIMVVVSPKTPPPAPGTCYIGFNNAKPPFNDYRVRQAFALAINRQALLDDIGWDDRQPATSFVPPGAWPDERYLYGQVGLSYNLDEAQAKLNEAGWPSEIVLGASDRALATAEFMADMWEKNLEIEVELVIIEGRDYLGQLRADAPQAYFLCWYADYKSPYNFLGDVFRSDSANNHAQFHNPDYDALLTEAALEADEDRKLELYTEAERMLCETDAAIAPLYHYMYYPSD